MSGDQVIRWSGATVSDGQTVRNQVKSQVGNQVKQSFFRLVSKTFVVRKFNTFREPGVVHHLILGLMLCEVRIEHGFVLWVDFQQRLRKL